jgi:hypothetical protein
VIVENSSGGWNFSATLPFSVFYNVRRADGQGMLMKEDRTSGRGGGFPRSRRGDDGLGANSDIGAKLRALYGATEQEPIPSNLLDLLEKLDKAEMQAANDRSRK